MIELKNQEETQEGQALEGGEQEEEETPKEDEGGVEVAPGE